MNSLNERAPSARGGRSARALILNSHFFAVSSGTLTALDNLLMATIPFLLSPGLWCLCEFGFHLARVAQYNDGVKSSKKPEGCATAPTNMSSPFF